MVPDIAKNGHSFKGAMAYYLHDKRQDAASPHLATADRVAWTETRNLATDGAHTATRIMIATALQADELKAAAGIPNTGRKSKAHVCAYSLAWHPDEAASLTREEMLRAADSSLAALGATDRQAVIVCHTDRGHPHVHVIVNRVHPETGVMLSTSNERRKLDEWAYRYEKERGKIVTPDRAAKHERIEKQRAEQTPAQQQAYADGKKAKAAAEAEARRAALADVKTPNAATFASVALANARATAKPPSQGQILKDLSDAQKIRHRKEWADLSAKSKADRSAIYDRTGAAIKAAAQDQKAENKPAWAQFYREEKASWREFRKFERSVAGVLALSFAAAKLQQERGLAKNKGLLSLVFANVLSSDLRAQTLRDEIERDRMRLQARLKSGLDMKVAAMKADRSAALAAQRETFGKERAALIEQQNAERAKVRDAWRQLYERRGRTITQAQDAPKSEPRKDMRDQFDNRASGLPNAPKAPHKVQHISAAQPQPTPAGTPPARPKQAQEVPTKWADLVAPAKVQTVTLQDGRKINMPAPEKVAQRQASPQPAKDWMKAAEPTSPPAQAAPMKDWMKAAEPSPAREIKPLNQSRDIDRDRDR